MPKAKVLGHDPLSWIRSTKASAEEDASSGSAATPSAAISQPPPSEERVRPEGTQDQAATVMPAATVVDASVAVAEPHGDERTAVAEETEAVHQEVAAEPEVVAQPTRTFEIRSVAEYLNEKFTRINGQEEQTTCALSEAHPQGLFGAVLVVIAVLLVALGYIAYSDAMGRIERLNKRIRQMEQQMPVPPGHEVNF
ncbi:MAG: hypothetical protein FJ279_07935 [Planctomycetes bacterium]|nr:hypothetical protein [Planctomycetota bacterium]